MLIIAAILINMPLDRPYHRECQKSSNTHTAQVYTHTLTCICDSLQCNTIFRIPRHVLRDVANGVKIPLCGAIWFAHTHCQTTIADQRSPLDVCKHLPAFILSATDIYFCLLADLLSSLVYFSTPFIMPCFVLNSLFVVILWLALSNRAFKQTTISHHKW